LIRTTPAGPVMRVRPHSTCSFTLTQPTLAVGLPKMAPRFPGPSGRGGARVRQCLGEPASRIGCRPFVGSPLTLMSAAGRERVASRWECGGGASGNEQRVGHPQHEHV
jgi:hypothetical protein